MHEFMDKEQKKVQKQKKIKRFAAVWGIIGFLMLYSGISTEDVRDQMSPEQAKKELASPKKTYTMMGVGMASMLGAALLARKVDKDAER